MALSKDKKKEIFEKLETILKNAKSVVFVNFHGLGVAETTAMRSELAEQDVSYTVAKKTLVKRALSGAKVPGDMPELSGELALVYTSGDDEISPARGIHTFVKKHKDSISILGGIFEGSFIGKEAMTDIALIPSLETLRAQFVNIINSPIQGLAVALNEVARSKS
ncbi:TPA: 50S ribosomal protein L10 [Candidatus Peribacteria bacterium]|jgi:large subunit ribosomal protein L10|nr:50S ribosomal protein L10 [Candidatus Peribacteria bacterium]|tara:strand:- start:15720 stop:16214 length:495 start_codon:yes stop_codon:yes gene_type:complete